MKNTLVTSNAPHHAHESFHAVKDKESPMSFAEPSPPEDLTEWGLHAFSLGARSTPHHVLHLDHNGALLYLAREGITKSKLAEHGIVPTESQLELLRTYDLIDIDGDNISTRFPVIDPETISSIRTASGELADSLAKELTDNVSAISAHLREHGFTDHDYAVVFGYVIDGLFFTDLKAKNLVPTTELTIDRPFWNGVFWALHPRRDDSAGTNEVRFDDASVTAVWTKATAGSLMDYASSDEVHLLVDNYETQQVLPVITAGDDDVIHRHAQIMSERMTEALTSSAAEALYTPLPTLDRKSATVIICHELIWDVMERLTEQGALTRPSSFDSSSASRDELSRQCFIVRSPSGQAQR